MFEDFFTIEFQAGPRIVNTVCDLPSLSFGDMWFPCCRGQLFRIVDWMAVYLDRIDSGYSVDPRAVTGHPIPVVANSLHESLKPAILLASFALRGSHSG